MKRFAFAGGGTGGHIYPALAVAREISRRGHDVLFLGNRDRMEARLVPEAGFPIEFVRSGALNRVGLATRLRTLFDAPAGVLDALRALGAFRPAALFSTGGYVTAPVMLAAKLRGIPFAVMEPNATPGWANRILGRWAARALLGFDRAASWFPGGRSEVSGLPVRSEFFLVTPKREGPFTVLITGGSQGARTLNRAARESWPLLRDICVLHQTGPREYGEIAEAFERTGLPGRVMPFVENMPEAFSEADLVVARAGAGSVSELAAAGMPSILVPLPFAADDHQRRNAEQFVKAGAAAMLLDAECTGVRLQGEIERLRSTPGLLSAMRERVRAFAHPEATNRAADVLESLDTIT